METVTQQIEILEQTLAALIREKDAEITRLQMQIATLERIIERATKEGIE